MTIRTAAMMLSNVMMALLRLRCPFGRSEVMVGEYPLATADGRRTAARSDSGNSDRAALAAAWGRRSCRVRWDRVDSAWWSFS
jgi:hypothetical protein